MTTFKNRPGYGLYETRVRDKKTGRVTVERRWMRDHAAFNLNADPVPPTSWDSTGWLPDGRHRKTGTPLNPDGVPVEYDLDLRSGDASVMTDAGVAKVYRAGVPASYAAAVVTALPEWRRGEAPDAAVALHKAGAGQEYAAMLVKYRVEQVAGFAREGIAPDFAEAVESPAPRDGWTLKEVPVLRDGKITMANRRVWHTDRDDAHKSREDQRREARRPWQSKPRPVRPEDLAQPEDPRHVRLPWAWAETRKVIKRMGGKWDSASKTWRLPDAEKAGEIRRFLEERATREGVK